MLLPENPRLGNSLTGPKNNQKSLKNLNSILEKFQPKLACFFRIFNTKKNLWILLDDSKADKKFQIVC
jgi:hypothetical protein